MSRRDQAERSETRIPKQRQVSSLMDKHKAEVLRQKRQSEIKLLAQGLHWVSRHSDMGALDEHACLRIAEYIAGSGGVRRLVALDNEDDFVVDIRLPGAITVAEAIDALNTEVAHQWRGQRIPANPIVRANGVRDALRRLEDRGREGE